MTRSNIALHSARTSASAAVISRATGGKPSRIGVEKESDGSEVKKRHAQIFAQRSWLSNSGGPNLKGRPPVPSHKFRGSLLRPRAPTGGHAKPGWLCVTSDPALPLYVIPPWRGGEMSWARVCGSVPRYGETWSGSRRGVWSSAHLADI
ncbi:hypothetical protein AAFF_G00236410 [Aldrovandia affinis]|uniref:Uncharacterized protein n=1 Tax=Aldrovandia affinis TaxID=143900 RepID=A0AAD7W3E3_9TELE|nr:hypothetical protein AAFF_G00236410 [Aldrovandia affinis]